MSAEVGKPSRIVFMPPKTGGKPQILLTVLAGPEQGQVFRILKPTTVIGRSTACDFVLSDPLISRQHCQIMLGMGGINLRDLGSTNGTLLNGTKVSPNRPFETRIFFPSAIRRLRFAVEISRETLDTKFPKVEDLAHKKLLTLYEVGNIVNSVLDLKTLLHIIMSMAIKVMQANRGFLLLKDAAGHLSPVATHALTPAESLAPYSQGIVDTVLKERVPVLVLDAVHDSRVSQTGKASKPCPFLPSSACPSGKKTTSSASSTWTRPRAPALSPKKTCISCRPSPTNRRSPSRTRACSTTCEGKNACAPALQRYMSPNVVDDIVKKGGSELKLGGEKKHITVLFTDIRGFHAALGKRNAGNHRVPLERIFQQYDRSGFRA
jgi:hypothetical protein